MEIKTSSIVVISLRKVEGNDKGPLLTVSLHDTQEFYNDLGGRSDEDLALSTALSIDDVVQAVVL